MAHADLLISLQKICMLVTITYLASRTDSFARLMLQNAKRRDRLFSYVFFSCLSMVEVLLSPHNPLMDARIVSATAAGLLGGVWLGTGVGVTTGIMSMLHSQSTVLDSGPAIVAGILGGLFYRYRPAFAQKVLAGFVVGVLSHGLWLAIRLQTDYLIGSWDSVSIQYVLPMLLSGGGVALFLVIIGDMRSQRQRIERSELAKAIAMANRTLADLSGDLDQVSAEHVALMVHRLTGVPAVAVAVDGELLAHVGEAADYHLKRRIVPEVAIQAMEDGKRHTTEKRSTWCDHPGCPFDAAVAAPLRYRENIIGSVVLFQTRYVKFRPEVVDLGVEVAQFLVNRQLQTADMAKHAQALSKAELKALQAQVHPHFLFNTLNTLAGMCEVDPTKAAELTVKLGDFFRSSFRSDRELVSTVREELATARSYLDIEKARFGDRLEVMEETEPETQDCDIPSFSLQPLVENSIVHGVSRKTGRGVVKITTRLRKGYLYCCVTDNGCGFDVSSGRWQPNGSHALSMLLRRMENIYGSDCRLIIRSSKDKGALVCIRIPANKTL